jgi:hypothetical protein
MSRVAGRVAVALTGIVLVVGVWTALNARFERGDVYPVYSSLRTDPVGCRVLFDSLAELDGLTVERSLEPLSRFSGGPETTLFVLGAEVWDLQTGGGLDQWLVELARSGNRVVVTVSAKWSWWWVDHREPDDDGGAAQPGTGEMADPEVEESAEESLFESEVLGVAIEVNDVSSDESSGYAAVPVIADPSIEADLPATLDWRSPFFFGVDETIWRVVYSRDVGPVLVERSIGRGSLVLASDTYLLSNEGLFADRQTRVVSWLIGDVSSVVFDESHLGVQQPVGVMVLIRRYRLLGFFAGVAVLALLFVWRSASPFVPSASRPASPAAPRARTSQAALVHVLSRGLADDQLLRACTSAWKRSFSSRVDPAVIEKIDELEERSIEPASGYRAISNLLATRRVPLAERGSSSHE